VGGGHGFFFEFGSEGIKYTGKIQKFL